MNPFRGLSAVQVYTCKNGKYNVCANLRVQAFQADGAAQDYFIVNEDRLVLLPESVSYEFGAMVEPTAVAAHATARPSSVLGKNVVVSGAGTIGNLIAQFVKSRGANKVLITDIDDYRLSKAKECGIEYTVNVIKNNLQEEIHSVFGEEGFQVGFECAGVETSLRSLMQFIEKGGDIVIVGVHAADPSLSMYYLGEHELNLLGSMMYLHEDFEEAVKKISSGDINLAPLISNTFSLDEYKEAYDFIDLNRGHCMKVIINLEK